MRTTHALRFAPSVLRSLSVGSIILGGTITGDKSPQGRSMMVAICGLYRVEEGNIHTHRIGERPALPISPQKSADATGSRRERNLHLTRNGDGLRLRRGDHRLR